DVAIPGGAGAWSFSGANGSASLVLGITRGGDSAGGVTVSVPPGAAVDAAGNPSVAATPQTRPFDTSTPPGVAITDDTGGTASGNVTFTFTFTEPVNGFTASDVEVSAGSKGAFTGDDGDSVYTLVVTPPAGAAGSFTVDV